MEQTKALNALEPFIALSKSASSPRAAADLISRATSAPNTYIFAELLQSPALQTLAAAHPTDLAPHLALLRLFSYGSYAEYETTPGLPPLNDAQRLKLRQLSLLSLAASGRRADLSYADLLRTLRLDAPRELEVLVTTAIYAGLLDAKLDPARQRVQVTRVAPLRDLRPDEDVPRMRAALHAWSDRCAAIIDDVERHTEQVRQGAAARAVAENVAANKMARAVTDFREMEKKSGGKEPMPRRAGTGKRVMLETPVKSKTDEDMDVDGPFSGEDGKKRAGKRKM
ncbi:COP9 signalosome subunit 7 (CsnG) [Cordyceps militaris CM01]|uniref:COP9 signalosome subunit 7 (CsnG) n=1 Tax=Cordyceps militaris (strain CM01) TaxID=983644 RepID=G3JK91_CORMM|nr:COP9 signalosome subunit 7 (CsnG) [Cordyceps militaris CM01]EGX91375.1 COP9 signalosome subunit 7 (CsnG) [Cordyceps militaris CM01]